MEQNKIERIISAFVSRGMSIGFVWVWVWFLNPPIASSLVWLIAILFAEIQLLHLPLYRLEKKLEK